MPALAAPAPGCGVSEVEACLEGLYDDELGGRAAAAARIAALCADAANLEVWARDDRQPAGWCPSSAAPRGERPVICTHPTLSAPAPQALYVHASLLPTLARLLREDGRRSLELSAAVAGAFYALSCARQLHRPIGELQVGALLLELCQLEVQRTAQRIANEGRAVTPGALAARLAAAATGRGTPLSEQ